MREKSLKKYLAFLLIFAMVFGIFSVPTPVSAATRKCYTISSGNTTVYSNPQLTNRYGTIYGSDEVTVLDVYSSYSRVRYPISGGRTKTGYIRTSAILTATSGNSYSASAQITTYRRPGGAVYGYISRNDTVMVLGTSGSYTQVKYPVSGGYKYAFVPATNAQKYITGSNNGSDNNANSASSDQADALVNVAKSQVGTAERSVGSDDIFYNDWYYGRRVNNGSGRYPWCAVFVSWCANQAGISERIIPKTASTTLMKDGLISKGGTKHLKYSGYVPVHGDIIFFGDNANQHVGIVDYASGNTVYYIDGNNTSTTPHSVRSSRCSLNKSNLWGFVTPAYDSASSSYAPSDTTAPVIKNVKITNITSQGYTVSCTVTDNKGIDRVQFPTWTEKNGQDDIQRSWETSSAASGSKSGNTYTYYVSVSYHNNETGKYITHIYAYDTSGNQAACAAPSVTIQEKKSYYGDLNMDGRVTITDLVQVKQAVVGKITLNDEQKKRADVNGDGKINSLDVSLIQKYIVKQIEKFPVEK